MTVPTGIFPEPLRARIRKARIIAVTVIDIAEHAEPLAETLLEAGIEAMELTLRTEAAFEALHCIRAAQPEMLTGLGTLIHPAQVSQAIDAGAAFAVAPGLNPDVVRAAAAMGLPFAPGIMTPSDIECAVAIGCRVLKFFPAEPAGGVPVLKSISGPYAHLGLEYIPLGGLGNDNFTDYTALDYVPAVGGSWIAPRKLIQAGDWEAISARAREAVSRSRLREDA